MRGRVSPTKERADDWGAAGVGVGVEAVGAGGVCSGSWKPSSSKSSKSPSSSPSSKSSKSSPKSSSPPSPGKAGLRGPGKLGDRGVRLCANDDFLLARAVVGVFNAGDIGVSTQQKERSILRRWDQGATTPAREKATRPYQKHLRQPPLSCPP